MDTAGALVWSAEASHSEWTLGDRLPQAKSIGHPEAAAIGEGPDLVNLGGRREYRIVGKCSDLRGSEQPAAFQEGIETSGPPGAKEGCQGHLAVGALP